MKNIRNITLATLAVSVTLSAAPIPEDLRQEYQQFLLGVEREKEGLKGLLAESFANEIRQLGFLHRERERRACGLSSHSGVPVCRR